MKVSIRDFILRSATGRTENEQPLGCHDTFCLYLLIPLRGFSEAYRVVAAGRTGRRFSSVLA